MSKGLLANEKVWRILSNFWTLIFLIFVIGNFFGHGKYDYLEGPLSILYVSILTIYAGTKEFDRWYDMHESRHPGELFIALWTILLLVLFVYSLWKGGAGYKVSSETIADYIAVLSIFALTQKSKRLFQEKKRRMNT